MPPFACVLAVHVLFCFLPWRRFFAAGLSGLSLSDDGLNLREITAVANVRTSSSICVPSAINQRAHVDDIPAARVLVYMATAYATCIVPGTFSCPIYIT